MSDNIEEDTDLSSTASEQWNMSPPELIPSIPPSNSNPVQGVETNLTNSVLPVGLLDPVLSNARRKRLELVNRLHNLGIQQDIDLPTIVVIGSQSAGKSSLIESISGINLPRSGGTCTRCPTECRLISTPGEQWQCVVSLRFLTDRNGTPLDKTQNETFGDPITNPQEVEERLRRGQLAILNPSIPYRYFLEGNDPPTKSSLNFSNNTVCLEIKGPDVTDLSFCDLPGLIASVADGGRDEDVDEVRELVASYIQKDSCIILLTVACESDFETQGAYRLARQYDPKGVRTIGVLTKPDRIPPGDMDHARWLRLIRNESSPLDNGWFCVKQLSSIELQRGYTFEESRRRCENFFKETYPWKTLDSIYKKRLGTEAVTVKLNEFLMSVISKRVPEIIQELQELVQNTKKRLRALPASPSTDPLFEIMHLINQFCNTLYSSCKGFHVAGDDGENLISGNQFEGIREVQNKFRAAIGETALIFVPYARKGDLYIPTINEDICVDIDDARTDNGYPSRSPTPLLEAMPVPQPPSTTRIMYLDDISAMASRAVTRELPGFYPFHIVQDLITRFTEEWEAPAFDLINNTFNVVCEHQTKLINSYFEKYIAGGLYQTIKNLVNRYMEEKKEKLEDRVKWLLKLESSAFTLNNSLFLTYKDSRVQDHERVRRNNPGFVVPDSSSALIIITTVEAYFQVAHKRFVDNVPLAVDHDLVRIEKRALEEVLSKGLKLTGPHAAQHCAKFLAESTEISDLRKELNKRLERLKAAQAELLDI